MKLWRCDTDKPCVKFCESNESHLCGIKYRDRNKDMTDRQYLEEARVTLSTTTDKLGHFTVGLVTESAELLDAYKKHKWYGREIDTVNMKEEIGDMLWYLIQLCDELDYSLDKAKVDNIQKLKKRYPEGFKDVKKRDTQRELSHIDNEEVIDHPNQTYMDFGNE
jgi:NTP pyrophosphatase (non-canonical NTP hydrolase)